MRTLVCIGLGYCATHYVEKLGKQFDRVIGTTRSLRHTGQSHGRVQMVAFDGRAASPELIAHVEESDALLISAPPGDTGDPVLASLADAIARRRVRSIVYLSTIGVYGDTGGAWVDEESLPKPGSPRSIAMAARLGLAATMPRRNGSVCILC